MTHYYANRLFHIWKTSDISIEEFAAKLGKSKEWVISWFRIAGHGICCNDRNHTTKCGVFYTERK